MPPLRNRPPKPLRWRPPPNAKRARRKRRFAAGIGVLACAGFLGAALTTRQKLVGDIADPADAAARHHEAGKGFYAPSVDAPSVQPAQASESDNGSDGLSRDTFTCTVVYVTDGDTLRCAEQDAGGREIRVRISGIDAREKDGSCAPGHPCASAPPEMATAELERLTNGQALRCKPAGDTYGRVAAWCSRADGTDVSCAMMASGTVARWSRYWGLHRC
jgi:endonuclease YncB( thermonuclease family)